MVDENNEYLPYSKIEIKIIIDDDNNGIKHLSLIHI